ncbi:GNAT family N-acetyltransferase [Undibacterium sp.]|uniref:GNAT family N-acetyltransferase n=1 Tax=Undibacterium sp. TaxID=1914977 RepID=UPI0025D6C326|nr:GNAT family N-acetyltransferase [Undibacterium sp.]
MLIRAAVFPADTVALRALIGEYIAWLDMDLSYRGFQQEMKAFEEIFTRPSGMFLAADSGAGLVGCVGLKRYTTATAEVKRMYVRPGFRGQQLGRKLLERLIATARGLGYQRLILDAVPQTLHAQELYRAMGFTEIAAYYEQPVVGTKFFERCISEFEIDGAAAATNCCSSLAAT